MHGKNGNQTCLKTFNRFYYVCTVLFSIIVPSALADFKDDIGFNRLRNEYGSSLPSGQGVRVAQIEYPEGAAWAPDTNGEISGKWVSYRTNSAGGTSGHANRVANYLVGSWTSITPGVDGWSAFEALSYTGRASLKAGRGEDPAGADWDVENHSWGGVDPIWSENILDRLDYRIVRDNVVAVAGVDNYASSRMSPMIANAYNAIAVGSSSGNHATGTTLAGNGRMKPDLVGTNQYTSYATPIVASCATLLIGEINRNGSLSAARAPVGIKALLMAGATKEEFPDWQHSPDRPLDVLYGAGEVNIYNSYKMLVAGQQRAGGGVGSTGWDVNSTSTGGRFYFFTVPSGQYVTFSAVLAWNRQLSPDSNRLFYNAWLHNLDLILWAADGGFSLTNQVGRSTSSIDNVEHIYERSLPPGNYALQVVAPVDGETYGLAWRGDLSGYTPAPQPAPQPAPAPSPAPAPWPAPQPAAPSNGSFSDAGFEALRVGTDDFYAFVYGPSVANWSFQGYAGIAGNNSGFTSANPGAPDGSQVAFVQMTGAIIQYLNLGAGSYSVSAMAAQRGSWQYERQSVAVYVDGQRVGTLNPSGTSYEWVSTGSFTVGEGAHEIKFVGQASLDGTVLLDNISVGAGGAPAAPSSRGLDLGSPGFEGGGVGSGNYQYNPGAGWGQSWTFEGFSGLTGNGSGFTAGNPGAPEGGQVAFVQSNTGVVSQYVSFPGDGTYTLTLLAAQRGNWNAQNQWVNVYIDETYVGTIAPGSTNYQNFALPITTWGGTRRLSFRGTAQTDATVFLDQIAISY